MNKIFVLFLLVATNALAQAPQINIIPQPVSLQQGSGQFVITRNTALYITDEGDRQAADFFNSYLKKLTGFALSITSKQEKNSIHLTTKKFIQKRDKDAYSLTATADGVRIEGDTYAGTFYGVQTLIQLLPTTLSSPLELSVFAVPAVTINDYPRFKYRGMHLDACRHFFPIAFIKKYIDFLALHKLNYFHWHLTDDQGWRIEIKKYPALTSTAAYRNGTIIGRYPGTGNDNTRYGGFYTQEEVKEIVQYAANRHITVVPEIEMPGHASAAIAAYPWLSCFPDKETVIPSHPSNVSKGVIGIPPPGNTTGRPVKKVQETWGVFDDIFCAGKDSTFVFLQNVIDEVLPLFPSAYVHIGGDEAPKTHWKTCPACQARMKKEGLKDEHELQSYFIRRMEQYINAKGKTIIGWDEILEGGLAPNAIVMSWRGEEGGIEAAKQKHQVIMTPQKPLYFDHSQTKNEDSLTIGGYNPIEQVYAYDPVPKQLTPEQSNYIMGAQANVWTEYIGNPEKAQYMVFPRMSALSEVLWSKKESKDWKNFEQRLQTQFKRYDLLKATYSKAYYDLKTSFKSTGSQLTWSLKKQTPAGTIVVINPKGISRLYKEDSVNISISEPGVYKAWIIQLSSQFKPEHVYRHKALSSVVTQPFMFSKSTGKNISLKTLPTDRYPGQGGAFGLVNGVYSTEGLSYPDWLGWVGDDLEATIDLGKVQSVDSVCMHTINQAGSWIYLPKQVEVFISSDGQNFASAGQSNKFMADTLTMGWINVPVKGKQARYIKLMAKNYGLIPDGEAGAGNKAWLFCDELQIY